MSSFEKTPHINSSQVSSSAISKSESEIYRRNLLWNGFFISTLGFIVGLFIPLYANPRAGLATHSLAIVQGMFLCVTGLTFPYLKIPHWMGIVIFWLLVVSAYVGVSGEFLGAVFGLTKILVITAIGLPQGPLWMETVVEISTKAISPLILLACGFILFGLRPTQ